MAKERNRKKMVRMADRENLESWNEKMRQIQAANFNRMITEGILIKPGEFIERIGWSSQNLGKAQKAQRVFAVDVKGEAYYPSFFTDNRYNRNQLEKINKNLGDLPGPSKLNFWLTPKLSLGAITPLEALIRGKYKAVMIAAEGCCKR